MYRQLPVHRSVWPTVTTQPPGVPGWYGKLPSLGDFASRRLAPEWIETWDAWLAAGLLGWRERDQDHWLDDYLRGPSLRFLVMPGVLPGNHCTACTAAEPGQSWVGVLMPSVDRVGRYFPLTFAQALSHLPANANALDQLLNWLVQLDDLAVAALQDNWTPDQLEAQLHALEALPVLDAVTSPAQFAQFATGTGTGTSTSTRPHGDPTARLWALDRTPLLQSPHGKVLWWCDGSRGQQLLRVTAGLPQAEDFSALLRPPFVTTTTTKPPPPSDL